MRPFEECTIHGQIGDSAFDPHVELCAATMSLIESILGVKACIAPLRGGFLWHEKAR